MKAPFEFLEWWGIVDPFGFLAGWGIVDPLRFLGWWGIVDPIGFLGRWGIVNPIGFLGWWGIVDPIGFFVEGGIFPLECPQATAVFGQTVLVWSGWGTFKSPMVLSVGPVDDVGGGLRTLPHKNPCTVLIGGGYADP